MSNGKGNAVIIITLLIGMGGLGTGIYSIIQHSVVEGPPGPPGNDGVDGINGTLNNLVGVWGGISGAGTFFNLSLSDLQENNNEFFSLSPNGEVLHLQKEGWFKFSMRCRWIGLGSSYSYFIQVFKNSVFYEYIEVIYAPASSLYLTSSFMYVYCDGDDLFHIFCDSVLSDIFQIDLAQVYNEFVLEYVQEE